MTHATKAVMKMLLSDNIKLQTRSRPLYSEQELQNCVDKIEVVDYHQTIEHRGVRFTPTAAGHVLGLQLLLLLFFLYDTISYCDGLFYTIWYSI
jgi:cleavage and polyadenylation specificity factor subunit 3